MKRTAMIGMTLALVLTGGLVMTTSAQEPSDMSDACTTGATKVSGKIVWGGLEHDPQMIEPGDGSEHVRDFVFLSRIKADDDRIEGDTTATLEWDFYGLDRKRRQHAGVNRGMFRVENPHGSWEGPWTGIGIATDSWRGLVELTGADAYEGLSATLFVRSGESGPIDGVIYPTDLASCEFAAAS